MNAGRLMRCDAVLTAAVVASSAMGSIAHRGENHGTVEHAFQKKHNFDTDTD